MNTVRSVLVIDDNAMDALLTEKVLQKSGYFDNILTVTDGTEAIALFREYETSRERYPDQFPPLLILLDINMPLMDGFEFLEAYSHLDSGVRDDTSVVIMLTSSSFQTDRERAEEFPMVKGYVVKPMTRERARELAEALGC